MSFFGVPYEASVQTTYWGNRAELAEVLDLGARGACWLAEISRFGLDRAGRAYELLRSGASTAAPSSSRTSELHA